MWVVQQKTKAFRIMKVELKGKHINYHGYQKWMEISTFCSCKNIWSYTKRLIKTEITGVDGRKANENVITKPNL